MRVLIGGSRTIMDRRVLETAIAAAPFLISSIITGTSTGIDELASQWATSQGIPVTTMAVDWAAYGGRGQMVRDEQALLLADACIMVWDGFSRGTAQIIDLARLRGRDLVVHQCNPQSPSSGGTTTVHRIRHIGDAAPLAAHVVQPS